MVKYKGAVICSPIYLDKIEGTLQCVPFFYEKKVGKILIMC